MASAGASIKKTAPDHPEGISPHSGKPSRNVPVSLAALRKLKTLWNPFFMCSRGFILLQTWRFSARLYLSSLHQFRRCCKWTARTHGLKGSNASSDLPVNLEGLHNALCPRSFPEPPGGYFRAARLIWQAPSGRFIRLRAPFFPRAAAGFPGPAHR